MRVSDSRPSPSTRHPARRRSRDVERLEGRTLLSTGPIPAVPAAAARWAFDQGSGTTAADASGNNHAAALGGGVTWVAGNVGTSAVKVAGAAAGVATAAGPVVDTAASFTASAWVNLASTGGYQTVLSIAGTNVAGFYLGLRGDTGTFAFARLGSDATGTATVVAAPSIPATGTWYHLVGVDDVSAGTLTLYVDGRSMGTAAYAGGWAAKGDTLVGHGFYGGAQGDYVNGSVDEVSLYPSALSAAQVVALDQPAAYAFDDGTAATAADVSGHGNPLTLGAGASWSTTARLGSNALAVNGTATGNATRAGPVVDTARPFSVSAWVNLAAIDTSSLATYQTFVSIDGTNTSGFYLQLRGDTGKFAFTRLLGDSNSAGVVHADATAAPVVGTWYNLVGVNDPANRRLQLYVNGVLQSSVAYGAAWAATGATVIGGGKFNGARADFATGQIDDVRFYNSPLNAAAAAVVGTAGSSTITVNTATAGATVSPTLFGAFMEDINYGGEGGTYNDEVRNSGFNDSTDPLNAWSAATAAGVTASLAADATTGPTSALTRSGKLTIAGGVSATARAGIANAGYFGVAIAPSTAYAVSFYAKATAGFTGPLTLSLESVTGTVYATATVSSITTGWAQYTATLTTAANAPVTSANRFVISTTSGTANGATIWFGATYVNPPAYAAAANHLRVDLMQKLAAMKPAIFRVPGGNYLEGNTYADRFQWSQTIGPIDQRPGHYNSAWGYWSTDGMGLDEYLQMAEEVGSEPVLAVYAGYTLTGTSDTGAVLTADVTDAVNELHYVLDPVTTSWGAMRAANGHPAPYGVKQVEVGNEDFFSSTYNTRYPLFGTAIRAAFPSLKLIATSTSTGGSGYDVVDDHFYNSPQWFMANSGHYDAASRTGPKVFVGEWAANTGTPTNDMISALGDAAWLMGLERNSDLVTMESYAPIWANVNGYQWRPDLIGFDATSSYGSPSYYAQVMLANQHGTTVVGSAVTGTAGLQALVTRAGSTYYVTVVNTLGSANPATISLAGLASVSSTGSATTLAGSTTTATNSITTPTAIVPVTAALTGLGTTFSHSFPGYSVTVITLSTHGAPTVATAAAAAPSPVTGTTANLSVLGADDGGEATLAYAWSATGPAAVSFSATGTNAAKSAVATFAAAGAYTLTATITDPSGQSTTSAVAVTVRQTVRLTSPTVGNAVVTGATTQVSAVDQFGAAATGVTWSVSGGGTVSGAGLFTAPAAGGTSTVTATVAGTSTTLAIAVVPTAYAGGSTYAIRLSPADGRLEQVFVNAAETAAPAYTIALSQLPSLTFADGSLTVDFANGTPLPANGVSVTGGRLAVLGTSAGGMRFTVNGSQVVDADLPASPIRYSSVRGIEFDLLGSDNLLTQTAQPAAAVVYNGGIGANALTVTGGTFTFAAADPQAGSGRLTVTDAAAVVFPAPAAGSGINVRHLAGLTVAAGATATVATAAAPADHTLLVVGSLSVDAAGQLDLGGNDADVTGGTVAAVTAVVARGFAGGTWQGSGLASSAAAASRLAALGVVANVGSNGPPLYASFDGVAAAAADVLIRFTTYGDTNLDGVVNAADYGRTDAGYVTRLTGWANGDFNYDGVVDGSDYSIIDNAFNQATAATTAATTAAVAGRAGRTASRHRDHSRR